MTTYVAMAVKSPAVCSTGFEGCVTGALQCYQTTISRQSFQTISTASLIPIFGVRGLDAALPYQRRTRKLPH